MVRPADAHAPAASVSLRMRPLNCRFSYLVHRIAQIRVTCAFGRDCQATVLAAILCSAASLGQTPPAAPPGGHRGFQVNAIGSQSTYYSAAGQAGSGGSAVGASDVHRPISEYSVGVLGSLSWIGRTPRNDIEANYRFTYDQFPERNSGAV